MARRQNPDSVSPELGPVAEVLPTPRLTRLPDVRMQTPTGRLGLRFTKLLKVPWICRVIKTSQSAIPHYTGRNGTTYLLDYPLSVMT